MPQAAWRSRSSPDHETSSARWACANRDTPGLADALASRRIFLITIFKRGHDIDPVLISQLASVVRRGQTAAPNPLLSN